MAAVTFTAANVQVAALSGLEVKKRVAPGVSIVPGNILTVDVNGEWVLADFNSIALAGSAGLWLAAGTATGGQPFAAIPSGAEINVGAVLSQATWYYLGAAGAIVPYADITTGKYATQVIFAKSSSVAVFNPWATGVQKP